MDLSICLALIGDIGAFCLLKGEFLMGDTALIGDLIGDLMGECPR